MRLNNKRILITAGPTWVPIDKVRVISNIATGETGVLLAEKLANLSAKVTLLLGPVGFCCLNKNIRVIRFKLFDELRNIVAREVRAKKYDAVIQTAAVSDYAPVKAFSGKLKSGLKNWKLVLEPTSKIIDYIKKLDSSLFLVGFKFEPGANKNILIVKARLLLRRSRLDLVVANTIAKNKYQAYIINHHQVYGPFITKKNMAGRLVKLIEKSLNLRAKQCKI